MIDLSLKNNLMSAAAEQNKETKQNTPNFLSLPDNNQKSGPNVNNTRTNAGISH